MRLDKYLSDLNIGTRSRVKAILKEKSVTVNGEIVIKPEFHVNPGQDEVRLKGKLLEYSSYQYYLLNKPAGVVSATRDSLSETVIQLLPEGHRTDLFPVGRLDKDTEGFLLITNDGALAHELLSPKKHVEKTYLAKLAHPLSPEDCQALESGVSIGDETPTLPAVVVRLPEKDGETWIRLTIHEGRFHQVKRMMEAVGNEVLFLKRIRFGALTLDPALKPGMCRPLTEEEVSVLRSSREIARKKKALLEGKKAVIFDLDGSLIDSMWIWEAIDLEYLGRYGVDLKSRLELKNAIEGKSFHETAVYIKERYHIPDSLEQIKQDWTQMAYEKYEKQVPLKEGALEFLEGCQRNRIQLGIATSNSRELAGIVLRANHVEHLFQVILTGSDVPKGKPEPDIYLAAAKALSVLPENCLVFEDIMPGLIAGRNAGMTVCAVEDPDAADRKQEIMSYADEYIRDFYDFF